jgi:predicted glycosyltransferase
MDFLNNKYSEEKIRKVVNKLDDYDWMYISCNRKLSEEFIKEFQNKVYWSNTSCYQKLSEDFIREF